MPNTKSAIKAMRQSIKRRARNIIKRDAYKKTVKDARKTIASLKKDEAIKALSLAMKALDKAAKTHIIHKNKASRLKSRLAKAMAKIK